jgi:hypothetical protein
MTHPTDEDLVLHLYDDPTASGQVRHIAECADCAARVEEMRRLLWAVDAQPVPLRDAAYGARVWERIERRLDAERATANTRSPRRTWALAAAAAAIAVFAFLLGRGTVAPPQAGSPQATGSLSPDARERILLDAVSRHFDKSERVLIEASNATGDGSGGFAAIRSGAENLLASNRLYRQTAQRSGERAVAQTLEDLERALLEIANGPAQPSPEQIEALQRRLAAQGVLFKIRVLSPRVQAPTTSPGPAAERL